MDDDRPRPLLQHVVGEDLSRLSVGELTDRIALLGAEIARLEAARQAKESSKQAADSVFRL